MVDTVAVVERVESLVAVSVDSEAVVVSHKPEPVAQAHSVVEQADPDPSADKQAEEVGLSRITDHSKHLFMCSLVVCCLSLVVCCLSLLFVARRSSRVFSPKSQTRCRSWWSDLYSCWNDSDSE
jgi:hypothetical protein